MPDLTVPSTPGLDPSGSDGVDLVHEDDGGRVLPRHHEQLPHHPAALTWEDNSVNRILASCFSPE